MAKRKAAPAKRRRGSRALAGIIVLLGLAVMSQGNQRPPNTATQVTVRPTRTAATLRPSRTPMPSVTPAPRQALQTNTPGGGGIVEVAATSRPTRTRAPAATQVPQAVKISQEDFTATGNANVRSCPQTTCDIVAGLVLGQRIVKVGEAQGASVNGSALWYEVSLSDGTTGYVHSGLVRFGTPRPAPVVVQPRATHPGNALVAATQPAGAPTDTAILFEPMTSTPPAGPQSPFGCNGIDDLNCGDFRAIGQNANAHLAACGDEDNLDGDGDGRACER